MKHKQFLENLIGPLSNQGGGGGGDEPTGSVTLTANGTYNVKTKAQAIVAVPPYGEGSVNINSNGTHNVSGKAQAVVAVPGPSGSMNITENGTYDVTDKAEAVVNVSGGGGGSANDWAYAFISGGYEGVLTDSTDPTVPRITKVIQYSMENELGLTGVNLPVCTEIGQYAFAGCQNIADLKLPVCTSLGNYAFQNCDHMLNVSIPVCKTLGTSALPHLSRTETLDATAVETIGSNAIAGNAYTGSVKNSAIKLMEFPALKTNTGGVQYFYGLTAVRLGSSVTSFQGNSFRYCTALDTVIFGQNQAAVPPLGSQYTFGGSPIRTGTGYVYVPDALEANWKAASLWSAIASHIKPLSAILTWTAGTYNKPDVVKHGGHYYRCDNDGTTGEPGVDTTNWQDLGAIY